MGHYSQFSFEKLFEGKLVVGVSKHSPLALEKKITPEQLVKQTLILYEDDQIRGHINSMESLLGDFEILFTSNNVQAIENAVLSGLGVTVGLDYSCHTSVPISSQDMVAIELEVPNTQPIYYSWARQKGKHSSQIGKKFIDRLKME